MQKGEKTAVRSSTRKSGKEKSRQYTVSSLALYDKKANQPKVVPIMFIWIKREREREDSYVLFRKVG